MTFDLPLPVRRTDVWYQRTSSCDEEKLAFYHSLLNDDERRRLQRFAFDELKREFLVTRGLCRTILSRYADIPPAEWKFVTNSWGKPTIDPQWLRTRLRFNLSNSRTLVACIVTLDVDAGIDVEHVKRIDDAASLADHYFSPDEIALLRDTPPAEKQRRFFELWTLKESYIKARGMGLAIPLDGFSFDIAGGRIGISFDSSIRDEPRRWQFALHRPDDDHVLAVGICKGRLPEFEIAIKRAV